LLKGTADPILNPPPDSGIIRYGTLGIDQRQRTVLPRGMMVPPGTVRLDGTAVPPGTEVRDFLITFDDWLSVQRGGERRNRDIVDPTRRFIRNLRDLANYVHFDQLYEAHLNACLLLLNMPAELDPGNPYTGAGGQGSTQEGFGTFGGPHILSLVTEVATRALKAVWFQKWFVHRRLRPEAFGGRIHVHRNGIPTPLELE
jgi:hypothetical protein